jgi:hypothetical protein
MANTYAIWNGAIPTTASQAVMSSLTGVHTIMQVATPATAQLKVIEFGISFEGEAAAQPAIIELFGTTVAATAGTAVTPTLWGNPDAVPSLCVGGTGATMFSDGTVTEGTPANVRMFYAGLMPVTNLLIHQFPLGREPMINESQFLRMRINVTGTAENCIAYIIWEE